MKKRYKIVAKSPDLFHVQVYKPNAFKAFFGIISYDVDVGTMCYDHHFNTLKSAKQCEEFIDFLIEKDRKLKEFYDQNKPRWYP